MASPRLPPGGFEIERDLDIDRDVATVFGFLSNPAKFGVVDLALVAVEPMTSMALGAAGRMTHRRGGMTARTTPTGTRVRFVDRVWPTSLPGRFLVALSGGIMQRDLQARAVRLIAALSG